MTDVVDLTHSSTSSGSVIMVSSRGLSLERAAGEPEAGLDQMKLDCTRLKGDVEELATRVPQGIGLDARPSTSERFPKHPDNCAARAGNTSVFDASRGSCQAAPHNRYPSGTGVRKRSRPGGSTGFRHHNGTSKESSERGETSDSDMEQGGETTQSQKRRKIGPAHRRAGHATQAGRRCFPQLAPGGEVGQPGQVASIELENFKCHEHFKHDFQPRVNVITGTNGSGKSAVLSGLQLALGSTFRQTGGPIGRGSVRKNPIGSTRTGPNRDLQSTGPGGSNVGEVIKTGTSSALVRVTMWNTGEDGFKPEVYGPQVTIERRIHLGGSSTWRMLDYFKNVISDRRQEVEDYLFHVDVHISNPVVCLTQEMAKAFTAYTDKQRYDMYMDAFRFKEIEHANEQSSHSVSDMHQYVKDVKKKVDAYEEEKEKLEGRMDRLRDTEMWQQMVVVLERAIVWTGVKEMDAYVEQHRKRLDELPGAVREVEAEIAQASSAVERAKAVKEELRQELEALEQRIKDATEKWNKHSAATKESRLVVKARKKDLASASNRCSARIKDKESLESTIAQLKEAAAAESEEERQRQTQKKRELEREVSASQRVVDESDQYLKERDADKREAVDACNRAQNNFRTCQTKVSTCDALVKQLRAQQSNPLAAFGGQAAIALNAAIAQNKALFKKLPIGPIGSYLQLTDVKWAKAVEAAIGRLFNTYLVHCDHDLQALKGLAHSIRRGTQRYSLQAIIYNFESPPLDLAAGSRQLVPDEYLTVLKVLKFPEDQLQARPLRNALIDHTHAERILLVETDQQAMACARDVNGPLGRGLASTVWAESCFLVEKRGKTTTHFPPRNTRPSRLVRDDEGRLCEAQMKLDAAKEQCRQAQKLWEEHKKAVQDRTKELDQARQKRNSAITQNSQCQSQLQEHQLEMESSAGAEDLSHMEEELQQMGNDVEQLRGKELEARKALDVAEAQVAALEQDGNKLKLAMDEITARNDEIGTQSEAAFLEADRCERRLEDGQGKRHQLQLRADQLQVELRNGCSALEELEKKALEVCTRDQGVEAMGEADALIKHERNACRRGQVERPLVDRLIAKKEQLQTDIARQERTEGGTYAELQALHNDLLQVLDKEKNSFNKVFGLLDKVRRSVKDRKRRYRHLRNIVHEQVSNQFSRTLRWRKWNGSIEIDYEARTLKWMLEDHTVRKGGRDVENAKQCSGGERSFVTLSFLIALAQEASSPVVFMDEFDVFMDPIYRGLSAMQLLTFAAEMEHVQLILLTPNSTQPIDDAMQVLFQKQNKEPPSGFLTIKRLKPARST